MAFWRKYTPFIDQKCTYENVKKNWAGPSPCPSFGQNPKDEQFFFVKLSLICQDILLMLNIYSCNQGLSWICKRCRN